MGFGATPEQADLANKLMHSGDRRYIEQASRSAPSPTVTVNKTSYSRSDDSSSKYSSSTQAQSSSSHGNYKVT
uniref:Uncharacterized protein n=1 Tax=Timema shepardi TaxID=629360 RepID=A0A7R9AWQ1_TIMSH|nr:unnamed protein product [Timema shepardi]